jgi:hypothetical protein
MMLTSPALESLCEEVLTCRDCKADLDDKLKRANALLSAAEAELMSHMANIGVQSFRSGGISFTVGVRVFASVENAEAALPWLREHGLAGLIKETVHSGTLSAAVKELREQGEIIPEAIRIYEKPTLSIRGR